MTKFVCALDPGVTGGIALKNGPEIICEVMPALPKGLDLPGLSTWLKAHKSNIAITYLEHSQAIPGRVSSASTFQFGRYFGSIEGVLAALGIPYHLVKPQTWQKQIHAGITADTPKDRSRIAVSRLYPNLDLRASERSKNVHEGMMDAVLIAHWGWNQHHLQG